ALGDVAHTGCRATDRGRGQERVGRAVVGDAIAALRDIAVAGGGPALARALRVRRTVVRYPVAALGDIAVTRCGTTDRAALHILRAARARPAAAVGGIADTGRRATDGGGGQQHV